MASIQTSNSLGSVQPFDGAVFLDEIVAKSGIQPSACSTPASLLLSRGSFLFFREGLPRPSGSTLAEHYEDGVQANHRNLGITGPNKYGISWSSGSKGIAMRSWLRWSGHRVKGCNQAKLEP